MTGGSAQKAMEQLLAGINPGKGLPGRYDPEDKLGFPDPDVFTSEARDRIKAITGDDPVRTARLSALVLEIARREFAMPVLPDLVDEAAAQLDLESAEPEADGADAQPSHEDPAARGGIGLTLCEGRAPTDSVDWRRHDPVQQTANTVPGTVSGVSAPRPRRLARSAASRAIGVVLIAAGAAGALAYTGHLDIPGLGDARKTATSPVAAMNLVQLSGQQQAGNSGDAGSSSPSARAAETEPPAGPAVAGDAVEREDERRDDSRNGDLADVRNEARTGSPGDDHNEAVAAGDSAWEADRRADEAALAERWPELEEAAEKAIKQRFHEVREQAEQARQALEALGQEMNQLHRRQHEEMQARHAQERAEAAAEGAGAVEQADKRHQQERAALERDQKTEQDRLADAYDELDRHLEGGRRDVARARKEAAGGQAVAEQTAADTPEESAAAGSAAAESGLRPQSGRTEDRQQQTSAATEGFPRNPGEDPDTGIVAPERTAPQTEPPVVPQQGPPESVVSAEPQRDDEDAGSPAGQPLPPSAPSPVAGTGRDTPPAENVAAGRVEAPEAPEAAEMTPESAEAAAAPAGEPASDPRGAAPASHDVAELIARGNALLDFGDLASARLFYRLAAGRGSAEGAMLMGMTFDPVYFAGAGIQGTQPQIQEALDWYGKAIAMGSQPAERRMGHLRSWLEQSAAAGNVQAKAALQQLR